MKTNEMTSIRFASEMSISFSSITQSPRTSLLANFSNQHKFQSHYTVFKEGTVTEFAGFFHSPENDGREVPQGNNFPQRRDFAKSRSMRGVRTRIAVLQQCGLRTLIRLLLIEFASLTKSVGTALELSFS